MAFPVLVAIGVVIITILSILWRKFPLPTFLYDILCWLSKSDASKPTNLDVSEVTTDSVVLKWTKPVHGSERITSYTILCRSEDDPPSQWQIKMTSTDEKVKVCGLDPKITYIFKVRPQCSSRYVVESDCSDPVETKPKVPGKPDRRPFAANVTENSALVRWHEPVHGAYLVKRYQIFVNKNDEEWKEIVSEGSGRVAFVDGLECETRYTFKVCAIGDCGSGPESDHSFPVRTKKFLAQRIKEQAKRLSSGGGFPELYAVPVQSITESDGSIARYVIGERKDLRNERVLMLVGGTGSGKTTLLNAIANYVCGIRLKDNFRFRLDFDEGAGNQAQSQTNSITAYTFYPMDGSPVAFPLTIIDTPGFGDTAGIERDKEIIAQMHKFFSMKGEHRIEHLNAVGFVLQSPAVRLTPTQTYIFDSVLGVFGKDVDSKIFLMTTFADSQVPPVLSAVKEARIPCDKVFKFNNSSLFAKATEDDKFTKSFWEMGQESLSTFFSELRRTTPISILLSKEVLQERLRLEALLQGLQENISDGLDKVNELDFEEGALKKHREDLRQNKNFTYEVRVNKRQAVRLPPNLKALNCSECFRTCHYPCDQEADEAFNCPVMSNRGSKNATCNICSDECSWKVHVLQDCRYDVYKGTEKRTAIELKARYIRARDSIMRVQDVIKKLEEDLSQKQEDVMNMVREARRCKERLNEIAFKPGKLTEVDYINLLVLTEKIDKKDGYMERIEALEQLKIAAEILSRLSSEGTMPAKDDMKKWWTGFRRDKR